MMEDRWLAETFVQSLTLDQCNGLMEVIRSNVGGDPATRTESRLMCAAIDRATVLALQSLPDRGGCS